MKKVAILLIGIITYLLIFTLILISCSPQEEIFIKLSDASDDAQVIIRGRTGKYTYAVPELDPISNTLIIIGYEHSKVHEGCSYICDVFVLDIDANDTLVLAFKTMPSPKRAHMIVQLSTLEGGNLKVWENVTWTTNTGTLNSIINRKREANIDPSDLLEDKTNTPAFTATGNVLLNPEGIDLTNSTSLHHIYVWGRKEKVLAGGNIRDTDEWILKFDTQYAVIFTSNADANKAQVILSWYEHTDEIQN